MEYKLTADSGSTKTDWLLSDEKGNVQRFSTQGINPVMLTEEKIIAILKSELFSNIGDRQIGTIEFYGAGCRGAHCDVVSYALQNVFAPKSIVVESDMLGAARALCGSEEGIICILGTGSNSCLYDGNSIIQNVSPLGFILGDEGSGAVLGKRLMGDLFKQQLPTSVAQDFFEEYKLSIDDIIQKVYREPMPNRFLASFAPFLHKHRKCDEIHALIADEFTRFFLRNVANYKRKDLPVHFVGSIAHYFHEELLEVANSNGFEIGKIKKAPLDI